MAFAVSNHPSPHVSGCRGAGPDFSLRRLPVPHSKTPLLSHPPPSVIDSGGLLSARTKPLGKAYAVAGTATFLANRARAKPANAGASPVTVITTPLTEVTVVKPRLAAPTYR